MTVYEYLISLPQPLFEATLMGLMGLSLNSEQESVFHEWMQSPYKKYFDTDIAEILEKSGELTVPVRLLGCTFSTLPMDKQTRLRNALKDYCEVCDDINQYLAEQRKGESSK